MTMTELSPAARAIFEAFNSEFEWIEDGVPGPQFKAIAAVLRSLVDNVHYDEEETCGGASYSFMMDIDDVLAISEELESQ